MNTAHFSEGFQALFLASFRALTIPPVMLLEAICFVSVVSAFVRQQPFRSGKWRSSYWLIFTQLLFFPAIVAIGVLFPAVSGWPYPKENPMGKRLLDALFYLSLATSALWLYRMKRLRRLSASLLA
jgi:hypothetical protein